MQLSARRSIVVSALFFACAQQMPPSGGEQDLVAPRIHQVEPPYGAVNVDRDAAIRFAFSEWINPRTAPASVAVFPAPEKSAEIEVRGKTLIITPKEPLRDSTTYHIMISSALEDLRGNPIDRPVDHIFATGPSLDSASISGCIGAKTAARGRPKIALFQPPANLGSVPDSMLLAAPDYLIQADSAGVFDISNIRAGTYALIGFIDEDNNNRLSAEREIPWTHTSLHCAIDSGTGPIRLFESRSDTAPARITGLRPHAASRIHGVWTSGPRPPTPPHDRWRLECLDTALAAPSLERYLSFGDSTAFALIVSDTMTVAPYRLIYPVIERFSVSDGDAGMAFDTIRFNGVSLRDTVAPRLISGASLRDAPLHPLPRLIWSEPVRAQEAIWPFIDSLDDTLILAFDHGYGDSIAITFSRKLLPGRLYEAAVPLDNFEDLAGNTPSDTTDTALLTISVQTLHPDSICYRLAGAAACLKPDENRIWTFTLTAGRRIFTTRDSAGGFSFDSIPAGPGTVSYFVDRNGDGEQTPGRLFPWRAPEPLVNFADTVEARARWEIDGVSPSSACRPCPEPHEADRE
jgi:hypothetical protein